MPDAPLDNSPLTVLERQVEAVRTKGSAELAGLLSARDGCDALLQQLPLVVPSRRMGDRDAQDVWDSCGVFYRVSGRFHEALAVNVKWYEQCLLYQGLMGQRIHKGTPLLWISECHANLGHRALTKRYLMLATCEDALSNQGTIPPETTGVYFRLVWLHGMAHTELARYAVEMWRLSRETPEASRFPEWVLQHVDQEWITGYPSSEETGMYRVSTPYLEWLLQRVGEGTGREFEILAEYMLSAMPGCRTYRRKRSYSTDYDVVCTLEGDVLDFRSELGRYFVTECKDWRRPVDVTAFAKFCRVLDSVKSRFGIIFSRAGITGEKRAQDAAREQLKVYQDRGMVIAVVTQADRERVATGENFISVLRTKYEAVRLDLRPEARGQQRQAARRKSKGTRR